MDRASVEREYLLRKARAERRKSDPLFTWQPHAKQREFIDAVLGTECYENWALWANRAGKTDIGAYCGARLARFGLPDSEVKPSIGPSGVVVYDRATSGWVAGVTGNFVRDVIAPKYFDNGFRPAGQPHDPFIPERELLGGKVSEGWRVSDKILRLKNGSIIGFKAYADGRLTFQGAGKDWIHFDEEPELPIFQEASLRIEAGRRLRIFGTCTLLPPEGQVGGVTWVYTEKAKPVLDGKQVPWRIFQASTYDNPHLDPAELARLEAQYPEGSVERRIRIDGELLPGISGSRAYGAFAYGLHVRDTGHLEPRRPLCWMWDFNVEPVVTLVGQRAGRVFKVFRELVLTEGYIDEMVKWFRDLYPSHRAEVWVYGDATGNSRNAQTGRSNWQLVRAAMAGYPVPVKFKVPEANPSQSARINAFNRALKDEYGEIGVEVDPACKELITDLEDVRRDKKGGILKTFNKSDPYIKRTHTSDAVGYWIAYEQPVSSTALVVPRDRQGSGGPTRMAIPNYSVPGL